MTQIKIKTPKTKIKTPRTPKKVQFTTLPKTPKDYGYEFKPTPPIEWGTDYSENEIVLLYYVYRYGYGNLFVKNVRQLSYYMGRTVGSISMNIDNIKYKMKQEGLTDYSNMMDYVVNLLRNEPQVEVFGYLETFMYNIRLTQYLLLKKQNRTKPELCKLIKSICYKVG